MFVFERRRGLSIVAALGAALLVESGCGGSSDDGASGGTMMPPAGAGGSSSGAGGGAGKAGVAGGGAGHGGGGAAGHAGGAGAAGNAASGGGGSAGSASGNGGTHGGGSGGASGASGATSGSGGAAAGSSGATSGSGGATSGSGGAASGSGGATSGSGGASGEGGAAGQSGSGDSAGASGVAGATSGAGGSGGAIGGASGSGGAGGMSCQAEASCCSATGAIVGYCADGGGAPPAECQGSDYAFCDGGCVDTASDPSSCGACASPCDMPANGSATCVGKQCGFTCDSGFHACGDHCADDGDATQCGGTCVSCSAPAHGSPTCMNGGCDFTCVMPYVRVGSSCEPPPPRPISPLTGYAVSTRKPTLTWVLPTGFTQAYYEVCADRACGDVLASGTVTGSSATVAADLTSGLRFWHVYTVDAGVTATLGSATWEIEVRGTHGAPVMSSWWSFVDMEGDGYADFLFEHASTEYTAWPGSKAGVAGAGPTGNVADASYPTIADVDGDGFTDVITLCAPESVSAICTYRGGPSGLPVTPSQSATIPVFSPSFLDFVGSGDVDGDGYADLVVGARPDATTVELWMFAGSATGLSATIASQGKQTVSTTSDVTGVIVTDVDADGHADVLFGDPDDAGGVVYVFRGGAAGLPPSASQKITTPGGGVTFFGQRLVAIGDASGDGYPDVVLGGGDSLGAYNHYAYLGGMSGLAAAPSVALPKCIGSVAPGGDFDGDGYSDFLMICGGGAVFTYSDIDVFLGAPGGPSALPNVQIPAAMPFNADYWSTGYGAFAGIGDANGDGFDDFVANEFGPQTYDVFFGAATLAKTPSQAFPLVNGVSQGIY